jgi:tetratricopeptide (TPR) repeat protein
MYHLVASVKRLRLNFDSRLKAPSMRRLLLERARSNYDAARRVSQDKNKPKEVRFHQARQMFESATEDYRKLGMWWACHMCEAEIFEVDAALLKDQTGRRKERIVALKKSELQWNKAAELSEGKSKTYCMRRVSVVREKVLKLSAIELAHDLRIDEATRCLQRALELAERAGNTDGVNWTKAALEDVRAIKLMAGLVEDWESYSEDQKAVSYDEIIQCYDSSVRFHKSARNPDIQSLNFATAMRALFRLLRFKSQEACDEWRTNKSLLPPEVFSSQRQSERYKVRRVFQIIASELIPIVHKEESELIKREAIAKLQQLEVSLKQRAERLQRNRPEWGHLTRQPLGTLFAGFEQLLGVGAPSILVEANQGLWVGEKHPGAVPPEQEGRATETVSVSLGSGAFDESISEYLENIDRAVAELPDRMR